METDTEITPHVKAVAETYNVHPALAAEFAHTVQPNESETQQPEQETTQLQQQQQDEQQPESVRQEPVGPKESFKELRLQKEKAERERDEYAKILARFQTQKQQPVVENQPEDEGPGFDANTLIEGKHLSKYDKKLAKMQKELQQTQFMAAQSAMKYQLKSEYPDFDKVVTPTNIERLSLKHPELAKVIDSSNDLYVAGKSAYELIKKFDIYVEDQYENDRYKVKENSLKPRPVSSVTSQQGSSPLSKANAFANGLTKELQQQLLKEMAEARKGL